MHSKYNFVRIASVVPETLPCNVKKNIERIIKLAIKAEENGSDIVLFPELSVTSYTCGDLFRQKILLDSAIAGLAHFMVKTKALSSVFILGIPLMNNGRLFNCAVCIQNGTVLGIVPKTFIPNNNEYYEGRWFSSSLDVHSDSIELFGKIVQFKPELIFISSDNRKYSFAIEICEDLWAVSPPSSMHTLMGAEIILNLSSSNELAGKAEYRRNLIKSQSGRCLGAYAYSSSGIGESTTDTVFGGHALITENGKVIAENSRFLINDQIIYGDIDLDLIRHERINNISFGKNRLYIHNNDKYEFLNFKNDFKKNQHVLHRKIDAHPFIPDKSVDRSHRCEEIINIQSSGLAVRLKHSSIKNTVIGLSGGLDSTLALLIILEAYKKLDLDKKNIHCITMPGFGTTGRTKNNVVILCRELGLELEEISIVNASKLHLDDIGHNGITHDITFENTQARERTQILMDKSNLLNAIVVGTGDLSELALGWCTYNGDHMSMYSVNSGVPKTLVSYLIAYYAEFKTNKKVSSILKDIIDTPISPELLPPDSKGNIKQRTEDKIGPYELHDFFLYQIVRLGYNPEKVLFLAGYAFKNKYPAEIIKKWLIVFYRRFFSQQFKRSALPDGPKVGTIALSPRADWRMPSDASAKIWLDDLEEN